MTTVVLSSTKPFDGRLDPAQVTEPMFMHYPHRRLLVHATSVDQLATEAALLELSGEETRIAPFAAPASFWSNSDGCPRAHQTSGGAMPPSPDAMVR